MSTTVTDNAAERRFELQVNGELAGVIMYRVTEDVVALLHTETLEGFEGRGLGSELVQRSLDDLRARGLRMQPLCPYVKKWLTKHPEYQDLAA